MRWQCLACEASKKSGKMPGWCECGAESSFVLETGQVDAPAELRASRASDAIGELGRLVRTGESEMDALLDGGIVEGSAVLVHGLRGSGKTRLVTRWASLGGSCLFAHAELSRAVAAAILQTTGANMRGVWLWPLLDGWESEARRLRARSAVVDSISLAKDPAAELVKARAWAQDSGGVAWCIAHENAEGKAKGGTAAAHLADYELRIEPGAPGSGVSRVRLLKSRLGPAGSAMVPLVPVAGASTPSKARRPRPGTKPPGSQGRARSAARTPSTGNTRAAPKG